MNSGVNDDDTLPDGWVLCQSKSNPGRKYYFNKKTGKSSWTKPKDEDPVEKSKKYKVKNNEEVRNNLKRKSDGHADGSSPKKKTVRVVQDTTSTPENKRKSTETSSAKSQSPTKNSANKRLLLLRRQLANEVRNEEGTSEQMRSPTKRRDPVKHSPKITETPKSGNRHATELKSPQNDPKNTNRSPSTDSVHSIPSPSQFLTANKIISSMKAQLPDEYSNKTKAKDTFADIDQAICNQMPEYPSTKHPATPPQFSEASKLVSAIKSKLAYKALACTDSKDLKTFISAKQRLESLRTSLSKEVEEASKNNSFSSCDGTVNNIQLSESMEIDEIKELRSPQMLQVTNVDNSKENVILVVDTNIFIHELDIIKSVLNSHIKGYTEQPTLMVPWRVINELDRLKDNNNGNGAICKRAKAAMDYLYKSLPENNRIKGQSLRDANSHIYPCELPDDEILNCCLQQAERGKSVILLSNDKNLCNKAIINGIKSIGLVDLKGQLENKVPECDDPDLQSSMRHYENSIYQLLANILENEMRAKYNTLWQHVIFKAPPWTLRDVLQCLLKHWLAVFSEVFPRIEHVISELKNTLTSIEDKGTKSLNRSEVNSFKELSLEIARKCQIIPEYMALAKLTVERIGKKTEQMQASAATVPDSKPGEELSVIGAFEDVWTVFSAYCAKLSSSLGLVHSLEDRVPGEEPLPALTCKWAVFSSQIYSFANAIKDALDDTIEAEQDIEENMLNFECVFKESLALISADCSVVNKDNLRLFCVKCRNMLQEAYSKFIILTEQLDKCRTAMKT